MTTEDTAYNSDLKLETGSWRVDSAVSELGFTTKAMFGLPVRGKFSGFSGSFDVADSGKARGILSIETETISTGIKMRDRHLRKPDFFAVEQYPKMRFELEALASRGNGTAVLDGTLHIRDRELPISIPVAVTVSDSAELTVSGDFEIDHHNAGFEFKQLPKVVHVKVRLTLTPVQALR